MAEASLNEAMQRWNSSVSRVVGMKKADNTMNTHALNKAIMKNAMESEQVMVEEKENVAAAKSKATPAGKKAAGLVTKEEWSKVRQNLRNKAQLEDVNELFRVIVTHCNPKHAAATALSAPELIAAGGKIKHAGDVKLEILRSLKKIKVTRDGIAPAGSKAPKCARMSTR